MRADEDELLDLVASMYEAAADPLRWTGVVAACTRRYEADAGGLFIHDFGAQRSGFADDGVHSATHGFSDHALLAFANHYGSVNVWAERETNLPAGIAVTSSQLFPDDRLFDTEFGCDWLRPQGLQHALGGVLFREGQQASKFSVLRSSALTGFSAAELADWQRVMLHMQGAMRLATRTRGQALSNAGALAALDAVALGMLWIGRGGHVLHANRAGTALLGARRGLSVDGTGHLRAEARHDASLQRLLTTGTLASAGLDTKPAEQALQLSGREGRLQVIVSALPHGAPQAIGGRVAAIVFLSDPDRAAVQHPSVLRGLFGFTAAEARLTVALCEGAALDDIATRFGITIHTARTQLRSAAAKAGVSRQAELVRAVMMGPAAWLGDEPPA
jgi:DNA-binding CsgD family transcriptional regulator